METNKIYQGDCGELIKGLADESVNCVITSPPFYGLRDYGTAKWEGGDVNCDHLTPNNDLRNAGKKQLSNHGSVRYEKRVCRKCGAIRVDAQIGLEESPDCGKHGLLKIKENLTKVQKDALVRWFLGEAFPCVLSDDTDGTK